MSYQKFQQPLELWVKEDLILSERRPSLLLINEIIQESNPELAYWNLLRDVLPKLVKTHKFNNLQEAGSLVLLPNDYKDYDNTEQKKYLDKFRKEVLDSGRTLITFSPGREYKPVPGEIVFATSVYRALGETLIPIPTWLYDLRSKISEIPKPSLPTVNFVGNTKYPGRLSSLMAGLPLPHPIKFWLASSRFLNRNISLGARRGVGRIVRNKVIQVAKSTPNLQAEILERTNDFFLMTAEEKQTARVEYLQHIQDNAYTICMRGDNNT